MAENASLGAAKTVKNDEFYTRHGGIEAEMVSDERVFEAFSNAVFVEHDSLCRPVGGYHGEGRVCGLALSQSPWSIRVDPPALWLRFLCRSSHLSQQYFAPSFIWGTLGFPRRSKLWRCRKTTSHPSQAQACHGEEGASAQVSRN